MDHLKSLPYYFTKVVENSQEGKLRNILVGLVLVFQLFAVVKIFAQTDPDWCYDGVAAYESVDQWKMAIGGDPDTSDNLSFGGVSAVSFINNANGLVAGTEIGCDKKQAAERYGDSVGLLGAVDKLNQDALNNPPTVDVVAHMANEWVPGYEVSDTAAYADGYDYLQSLNISDLWEQVRMIAYLVFVVVLIIAGFMIMFRQKIGGQTMITIFNTLPNVIVGLILVTFSFAIVGLVIDFGAVLMTVVGSILDVNNGGVMVTHPFSLMTIVFRGEDGTGIIPTNNSFQSAALITAFAASFAVPILNIASALLAVVVFAFLGIVLFASIKVYITLLKAYVGLIIDTILAPIFLVVAVIPGKTHIGKNWFLRIIKHVMTFVGVYFFINLAIYLFNANIDFIFPSFGSPTTGNNPVLNLVLRAVIPIALFFFAAEIPNLLSDLIPADGGKGAGAAAGGVQKSISKIPLVGSFFG
jgi:hypothetical protein